jgi:hypothetical protein
VPTLDPETGKHEIRGASTSALLNLFSYSGERGLRFYGLFFLAYFAFFAVKSFNRKGREEREGNSWGRLDQEGHALRTALSGVQ